MQLVLAVDCLFGSATILSFLLAVHLYEKTGVPDRAANCMVAVSGGESAGRAEIAAFEYIGRFWHKQNWRTGNGFGVP